MRKSLIKYLLAIMLSLICLLGITACAETSDPQTEAQLSNGDVVGNSNYSATSPRKFFYYLKIDGIEGESKDSKHDKWIEVVDFSNASQQIVQTGTPNGGGESLFEPIVFTHCVDKATPKLQEACMKGTFIKTANFQATTAVAGLQTVIYGVNLEGLKIVSAKVYTVHDNETGASYLMEEVKMLINKMTWSVTSVGLDNSIGGKTEADYDQTKKS